MEYAIYGQIYIPEASIKEVWVLVLGFFMFLSAVSMGWRFSLVFITL